MTLLLPFIKDKTHITASKLLNFYTYIYPVFNATPNHRPLFKAPA